MDLAILTYQDLKRGVVDARFNWYMGGIVGSLVALRHPPLMYVVALIIIMVVVGILASKALGKGDITALGWLILGTGLINTPTLIIFLWFFMLFTAVQLICKKVLKVKKAAFYPVIFGSFVVTAYVWVFAPAI